MYWRSPTTKLTVLLADGLAASVQMKQRQAVVLQLHLRVVAARREIRAGCAPRAAPSVPAVDSSREKSWLTSGFDAGSDES